MLKKQLVSGLLIIALIVLSFIIAIPLIENDILKSRRLQEERLTRIVNNINRIKNLNDVVIRNYVDVYFDLAKIYLKEKDFDAAIALYERGLQIDSWRTNKIFELACAYKNKAMYQEAYERFTQILTLKPDILTFLRTNWELIKLKNNPVASVLDNKREEKISIREGKIKDLTIYLLPFGDINKEMIEDLRVLLQNAFKVKFDILNPLGETKEGFDAQRNQYFILPLFKYVSREYREISLIPGTYSIMIITSFDITDEGLNFIFGGTDKETGMGIVSYKRFLLDHPDNKTLFKRLFTQSLSTAGFLLGMPRCSIPGCARSYPHSLAEFKQKSYKLCRECKNNLNQVLEKLQGYPEADWNQEGLKRLNSVQNKYGLE
ncbi:MAG: tetratricopeptide repeat protein [Candidatus Omnitrophota bacterium]